MKQQRAPGRLSGVRKSLGKDEQRLPGWIKQKHRERGELKRRLRDEDARKERALAKEAKAAERKKDREELASAKEFCRELAANWPRPRSKAASVSAAKAAERKKEAELLKLGGVKEMVERKDGIESRFIFGGVGETRLKFTPLYGACKVESDPNSALEEELKRELNRFGRGLWDKQREGLDLAVHAVDALLSCKESFKGLPSNKQQGKEVQFAIFAALEALKRDVENKGRKLQVAFEWLEGKGSPSQIVKLHHHAVALAVKLERPPSKSELRADFKLGQRIQIQPTNFATLLRRAGLGWLPKKSR
jgi:hypothetical protein